MDEPGAVWPVRAPVPWVREGSGVVVLLPKRLGPLARAVRGLTRGPSHLRVPLDAAGSRAFELADGTRTAAELAEALVRELGEQAGPPERAYAFLGAMARNGLLLLAREPGAPPAAPAAEVRTAGCACGRGFHTADPPGTRLRCPACGRVVRA